MGDLTVFTPGEYRSRVERTLAAMRREGVDALIAFANKVMPGHVRWLSGYETRHGIHDWSFCVLSNARDPALLTNVSWEDLCSFTPFPDVAIVGLREVAQRLVERVPRAARKIGIAGFDALPAPVYCDLARALPDAEITDASRLVLEQRAVKSPAEIAALRECARITDAGGAAFIDGAREGASEREVLVEVESAMKSSGSDEVSFTTQVGAGVRTAVVCPYATDLRLSRGDLVQLDCGATYQGYRGDLSRVVAIGTVPARQSELLDATAEMYDRMVAALRPGVRASAVARAGIEVAERRGLGDLLYRSPNHQAGFVGHGIGCSYTEPPEIEPRNDAEILENMVVVIEPIIAEPGVGGVKLEDAVLVTASGAERLSTLPFRLW